MYTDLIKIEHPPEAVAGQLVTIQVYIKNQYSESIYISPLSTVNGTIPVTFSPEYAIHPAGVEYYYIGTFVMPNGNAVITAWSRYWGTDGAWHIEDHQTRTTLLTGGVLPELETLEVDITPGGSGYVTTDPASEEGRSTWYAGSVGNFLPDTTVQVTAHPSSGYVFDHWSDEIEGGVSYDNPAMVKPMTERRSVKAHFREIDEVPVEALEVDITPVGTGYVTTDPASEEGKTIWNNNDTGTFPRGTIVQVTAVPNAGYVFDHWSDEIVGGTSENNPEYVEEMTEFRAVKAHFRETGVVEDYSGTIESLSVLVGAGSLMGTSLTEVTPPVTGVKQGQEFKIKMVAKNTYSESLKMGIHYIITKPDGSTIDRTEFEAWPYTGSDQLHEFIEPGIAVIGIDQVGDWSLVVELLAEDSVNVLDTRSIALFTEVIEDTSFGLGDIGGMIPMLIMVMMMSMMMQVMQDPMGITIQVAEGAGKVYGAVKGGGKGLFG